MSETLETPEAMAARLYGSSSVAGNHYAAGIRARDSAIADVCDAMAAKAQHEADAHGQAKARALMADDPESAAVHEYACAAGEGQALMARALAAMLRGAP
jgi:hypothetical protein